MGTESRAGLTLVLKCDPNRINQSLNESINQLSRCLISVSADSKAQHPIG